MHLESPYKYRKKLIGVFVLQNRLQAPLMCFLSNMWPKPSFQHDGENSSAKDQEKQGVRHRKYVLVNRDRITEEKRAQLPIYAEEIPIVETINDNIVSSIISRR